MTTRDKIQSDLKWLIVLALMMVLSALWARHDLSRITPQERATLNAECQRLERLNRNHQAIRSSVP